MITIKPYTKYPLNASKHVGVKCRKVPICSIVSLKRGLTHSKIGTNQKKHKLDVCLMTIKPFTKFKLKLLRNVG